MTFIDSTGTFGIILNAITLNITGTEYLTLLLVVVILIALTLAFRMPLEASAILVLPFLIVCAAYNSEMLTVLGVALMYLAVLVAKNLPFNG